MSFAEASTTMTSPTLRSGSRCHVVYAKIRPRAARPPCMKAPGAVMQGGLAALGLIFAYTTWQREPERKRGEVIVVDASANDIQKIRYEDTSSTPPKWVEIDRRKEDDGPRAWMKLNARPEQKIPEREVRGNESANKLFEKFTPLKGSRALGVLA